MIHDDHILFERYLTLESRRKCDDGDTAIVLYKILDSTYETKKAKARAGQIGTILSRIPPSSPGGPQYYVLKFSDDSTVRFQTHYVANMTPGKRIDTPDLLYTLDRLSKENAKNKFKNDNPDVADLVDL